jgi:peptide chain release factor subunit 1
VTEHAVISNELLDRLLHFGSTDALVLSLYVRVPADRQGERWADSTLHSLVKPVRELAESEELGHYEKQSLRDDIAKALELSTRLPTFQGRALAMFSCSGHGLYEEVVLPRGVRHRAVVDWTPYVRPVLAVLDESHRYVVVVVDREKAWLYEFFMDALEDMTATVGQKIRKRDYGGWNGYEEHRVRNNAQLVTRRHYRETAEAVEHLMARTGAEFLVVGGYEDTAPEFVPFLPPEMQRKVVGRFTIDTHNLTPARVRDRVKGVVDFFERREEEELVAETLELVAAGGLAAAGMEWVLMAVNEKAVQLLLVEDEEEVPGRACDNCGWLGLDGDECPVCGSRTRKTVDVIDDMAAAVVDAGGRVEHVYASTALRTRLVAARLRFPVPKPQPDDGD